MFSNFDNVNTYAGINQSRLEIYGLIKSRVKFQSIPDEIFEITFAVVPDNTISYDGLLGRDFLRNTQGLTINFSSDISFTYVKPISEILCIDAIAENNKIIDCLSMSNIGDGAPIQSKKLLDEIVSRYFKNLPNAEPVPYEMEIKLTSEEPFHFTPRRLSFNEKQELKLIIEGLLKRNIIRLSHSNYCSPIVLTKRKSGTLRLCCDDRKLNKITVRDNFP